MNRLFRTLQCALALLAITLVGAGASTSALAQSKEVITFAAVTFSEAGRGDPGGPEALRRGHAVEEQQHYQIGAAAVAEESQTYVV